MIFFSYLISFVLGWAGIAWLLREQQFPFKTGIWIVSGMLSGISISSILFISFTLLHIPFMLGMMIETLLAAIASFYCYKNAWFPTSWKLSTEPAHRLSPIALALGIITLFALFTSWSVFFSETAKFNHGEWDAWSHWNLRGKYIERAPDTWTYLFQYISHGDYPLFNSGYVARGWAYSGTESIWVPIPLAFLSTYCTAALLILFVWSIQGPVLAFLAGAILLGTPFFTIVGKYQFADTPLGFFVLAALGFAGLSRRFSAPKTFLILSGLMTGMATWTKNEGLLVALAFGSTMALLCLFNWKERFTEFKYFCWGLLPVLAVTLIYKYGFGPANDMTEGLKNSGGILPKITDAGRYKYISEWFLTDFVGFGHWFLNPWPWILGFVLLWGIRLPKNQPWLYSALLAIPGLLILYYVTYLLSFHELYYHLSTSFYRLCFHIFPGFICVLFLFLKPQPSSN